MTQPATRRDDRLVRMKEVLQRSGLCRTSIYNRMAAGTFPPSVRLGANSVAWFASDFDAWLANPMCWSSPEERAA